MTFDKHVKKRDHILFKLWSKLDVYVAAIEIVKKLKSIVYTVEESESIINVWKQREGKPM